MSEALNEGELALFTASDTPTASPLQPAEQTLSMSSVIESPGYRRPIVPSLSVVELETGWAFEAWPMPPRWTL